VAAGVSDSHDMRRLLLAVAVCGLLPISATAADWPTFHGDNSRQGNDSGDPGLANPAAAWTSPQLDGQLYAEPLVVGDQVVAATENNTVYSLDAGSGTVQWSTHLGAPRTTAIICGDIKPQGITSTPVVDGGNVYVVANIQTGPSSFFFELASLSLATGAVNWTANIDPPDNSNPSGVTWSTEALTMEDRGALLVTDSRVFVPMGGNDGDCGSYHGYVVSYPEAGPGAGSLAWWASTEVDAGDSQGADWAAGGLSVDPAGFLYVGTGNSNHTSSNDRYDYSDGVIKLDPQSLAPGAPLDYFAPSTWAQDNAGDADLGSTTPLQLPNGRIFEVGKSGTGYLLNSAALGHIGGQVAAHQVCHANHDAAFGTLAYAGGIVYVGCSDGLAAVQLSCGDDDFAPLWYQTAAVANHPPTVAGGLVWSVSSGGGQLLGFSAGTGALAHSLPITGSTHFTTPTAADALLLVAGGTRVDAFAGDPPPAASGPDTSSTATPTASRYQPLSPYRVLDTRAASCAQCDGGALGPGETRTIQVGGYAPPGFTGATVPTSATAVVLNVTGVDDCVGTYLTVFPAGGAVPPTSSLNPGPGQVIPNLVTVALGTSGGSPGYVGIFNAAGSIDVVADVEGYYQSGGSGSAGELHALSPPVRVCDTRGTEPANPCNGGGAQPLGPGESRLVAVADGPTGVIAHGDASAVVLNLTAVGGTAGTYLTVYPPAASGSAPPTCGSPPLASNLNLPAYAVQPNRVIAQVTEYQGTGYVCVFNDLGSIDVVLDVDGWFGNGSDSGGALFYASNPFRVCDTRGGSGTPCAGGTLGPGEVLPLPVAGAGPLPAAGMVALAANFTAVAGSSPTFLSVYPDASTPPATSDLNSGPGQIIANLGIVAVAPDGIIDILNDLGSIDVVVDAVGWFA